MTERLPEEVVLLLERRAAARAEHDWASADALRDELRGLGWEPIDSPHESSARALLPPAGGEPSYADDADLVSLLEEPAALPSSLVVVVDDHSADLRRFVEALDRYPQRPAHELVVVANAPADDAWLPAAEVTLLRVRQRLGWADAVNLGMRRARGATIVLLDTSIEPHGHFLTPLTAVMDDPRVGVAGPWGVRSADARQFEEAPPGEVDAVEGYCMAFRREALRAVGGFDHRFRFYRNADLDLSFAIRDAGWLAIATAPLPLLRHEHRGWTSLADDERDRLSKRNFYRFLKHWGDRRDLLLAPGARAAGR